MSYLEYRIRSVPNGLRKILYLNWPLTILIFSTAGFGFLMLYSVAGGSLRPWAEPQMKRFALGFLIMIVIAIVIVIARGPASANNDHLAKVDRRGAQS